MCTGCVDRFLDWLCLGQLNALAGVGAAAANVLGNLASASSEMAKLGGELDASVKAGH
jgi:hypothetical protein